MAAEPDWDLFDERLHRASAGAVARFAREHGNESACFFAFDSDFRRGSVLIAFDTFEHSLGIAEELQRFLVEERRRNLSHPLAWRSAKYHMAAGGLGPFMTVPETFKYGRFDEVDFAEWRAMAAEGAGPRAHHVAGYLDGNVRLVLWRVAERLVAEDAFDSMKLAPLFMVGYAIRGEENAVLRVVKWPAADGGLA